MLSSPLFGGALPPFALFFIGALLIPWVRGLPRYAVLLLIPVLGAINVAGLQPGHQITMELMGYTLVPVRVDRLSLLFGYLFHLAAFIAIVYSLHLKKEDHDTTQHTAGLLYAGSALGAVFAGDLITLFVFWELLALTSVFLIWTRGQTRSVSAGMRYLIIQVVSGVVLLAGILVHAYATGSIAFEFIGIDSLAGRLILLGVAIKAAFPFVHTWLTESYPEGTATGTVFLSAFTTKVAVYTLARGYPGTEILIFIGAFMACYPIFFAVIENDLRKVLSYSMMNQIGFMVVGVGVGTSLAVNGAVAHAFNDVLFKGLLFMSMGAVLKMTGTTKASELGGLYKTMPITATLCIIGAASISAVPLFNGFVSKAMIMSALLYEHHNWIWLIMLFASAGVVEHAGIKIPYFAFFAHDSGIRTKEPPLNMLIAMGIGAVLCIAIGTFPSILYDRLPFAVDYTPYDVTHVLTQIQLLLFAVGGLVALKLWGRYPPEVPSVNVDAEWVYRKLGPALVRSVGASVGALDRSVRAGVLGATRGLIRRSFRSAGPTGSLARTWPVGSMLLWVAILLVTFLVFYYFGARP